MWWQFFSPKQLTETMPCIICFPIPSLTVKEFWNRPASGKVRAKNNVAQFFFRTRCSSSKTHRFVLLWTWNRPTDMETDGHRLCLILSQTHTDGNGIMTPPSYCKHSSVALTLARCSLLSTFTHTSGVDLFIYSNLQRTINRCACINNWRIRSAAPRGRLFFPGNDKRFCCRLNVWQILHAVERLNAVDRDDGMMTHSVGRPDGAGFVAFLRRRVRPTTAVVRSLRPHFRRLFDD